MRLVALLLSLVTVFLPKAALAEATPGKDWRINFFDAATPVMEKIHVFHEWTLLPIITVITLFVLFLLIYVVFRFRKSNNPIPSKTTHHVGLEIIWTIVPVLILMMIAVPSIRLVLMQDETPKSDITIKAIGYQWYWGYEYPELDVAEYSAYMRCLPENGSYKSECLDKLKTDNEPHKLATDYPVVVPVNKTVRLLVTSMDVIHSWAMPSFGVKKDAVPGRMNSTWFKATKTGTYYGQCSELCGVNHAFMPITVEVVSQETYDAWLVAAKAGDFDKGNQIIKAYKANNLAEIKTATLPLLNNDDAPNAQQNQGDAQ